MRKVALALFGLLISLLVVSLNSSTAFGQAIVGPTATPTTTHSVDIIPQVVGNTLKVDVVVQIPDGIAVAVDLLLKFRPEDLVYQGWVQGRVASYYDYPDGIEYGDFYLMMVTYGVDNLSANAIARVTFQIKPEALEKGQTELEVIAPGYWEYSGHRVELSSKKHIVRFPSQATPTTVPVSPTPTRTPRPNPTVTPPPTVTPFPTTTPVATPTQAPVPYLELIFPESARIGQTVEVPVYIRTLGLVGVSAAEFQLIFDALSVSDVGFEPISGVARGVPDWIPGTGTFYVSVGAPRSRFFDGQRVGTLRFTIENAEDSYLQQDPSYLSFVVRKRNVVLDGWLLRVYSKKEESFPVRVLKSPVGDRDGDGRVTDRDLAAWLNALAGECLVKWCGPDPSGEGKPTITDLALMMRNYGP